MLKISSRYTALSSDQDTPDHSSLSKNSTTDPLFQKSSTFCVQHLIIHLKTEVILEPITSTRNQQHCTSELLNRDCYLMSPLTFHVQMHIY